MSERVIFMSNELHTECWRMLPWYVTGRISSSDRQRIELHLHDCAACCEELERQRILCEHIRRDESVMLAPQASLQKLLARIDASTPATQDDGDVPELAVERRTMQASRWLAIAATVQAVAIAVLLAIIWQQREAQLHEPRFTTLSRVDTTARDGILLRVVFKPEMTNAELQDLLGSVGAQVVQGPTEAGVFTLQLDDSNRNVGAVLERVRAHPRVVFAEHVYEGRRP